MTNANKSLSIPQLLVLTTAAARTDHMIMPLPSTLKARGASQQRLLTSLLKQVLVEEVSTVLSILSWRCDEAGKHFALKITAAGLAAVSSGEPAHELPALEPASELITTVATSPICELPPDKASSTLPAKADPAGKLGQVLAAVGAERGATVEELVILTGWQKHTTRAALTRLRQRGYPLGLVKQTDRKAYCLTQKAGE